MQAALEAARNGYARTNNAQRVGGMDTAALRRSLQRASALAARVQGSAHYAGVSRTARAKERRNSAAKSGLPDPLVALRAIAADGRAKAAQSEARCG